MTVRTDVEIRLRDARAADSTALAGLLAQLGYAEKRKHFVKRF
jgi:hypothetical protein